MHTHFQSTVSDQDPDSIGDVVPEELPPTLENEEPSAATGTDEGGVENIADTTATGAEWEEVVDEDGYVYHFQRITQESQWEAPDNFDPYAGNVT